MNKIASLDAIVNLEMMLSEVDDRQVQRAGEKLTAAGDATVVGVIEQDITKKLYVLMITSSARIQQLKAESKLAMDQDDETRLTSEAWRLSVLRGVITSLLSATVSYDLNAPDLGPFWICEGWKVVEPEAAQHPLLCLFGR